MVSHLERMTVSSRKSAPKIYFIIFAILISLCIVSEAKAQSSANATQVLDRYLKPFPEFKFLPEKEFEEKTSLFEDVPYGDESLGYKIRVPKDWQRSEEKGGSNFLLSNKLFSELAIFHSPPDIYGRSRMEISVKKLEYQVTAKQWYLIHILQTGMTTEAFVEDDKTKVEALMITVDADVSYVKRVIAQINGKNLILVEYYIPLANWQRERDMQAQIMSSFTLMKKSSEVIENFEKFQFLDVAEVKYPESWDAYSRPLRSADRMSTKFINAKKSTDQITGKQKEITEGQIEITLISLISVDSLIREIDEYKKSLENAGMLLGEKIENIDNLKYNKNFSFFTTEVYSAIDSTNDDLDYELWYSVMVAGNYIYMATLLTPARNESFQLWVRNSEAYKIILENITVADTGVFSSSEQL